MAACRNYIEIRFADGQYIGLRIYKLDSGVAVREVGEIGHCTFIEYLSLLQRENP